MGTWDELSPNGRLEELALNLRQVLLADLCTSLEFPSRVCHEPRTTRVEDLSGKRKPQCNQGKYPYARVWIGTVDAI